MKRSTESPTKTETESGKKKKLSLSGLRADLDSALLRLESLEKLVQKVLDQGVPPVVNGTLGKARPSAPVVKKERTGRLRRWKKIGGGSFVLNADQGAAGRRIIKQGQTFEAYEEDVPKAFRDVVIPLDDIPPEPASNPINVAGIVSYDIVECEGDEAGMFNVLNSNTGKVMNNDPLSRAEAEELVEALS